jgi:Tfp pilus assembly protein PilP
LPGKGYVLREGTYVGRNSGRVARIIKEKVIIEEEIEGSLRQNTYCGKRAQIK